MSERSERAREKLVPLAKTQRTPRKALNGEKNKNKKPFLAIPYLAWSARSPNDWLFVVSSG